MPRAGLDLSTIRADMESAPTVVRRGLPYGCRGRFYIGPSGASRTPPPTNDIDTMPDGQTTYYSKQSLERPCSTVEESAAGSRQTNIC